uniref:Kinesin family member 3B n=1 Tax=Canis lupus dingo TaxID=286419 RepID=A0A8C0JVX1_CANLU
MESKLLVGGKNIVDHTNEQQKILEQKRQEIAEQKRREREIQQQMESRDEETLELKETYSSLQQEVDIKTKKLKKLFSKLQAVKAEIHDLQEEHIKERQELEQTQNELTRELKLKHLIIENFIPLEEKSKIMNRSFFDEEEDHWKLHPITRLENQQMMKRPVSAVGYKRPLSQHARMSMMIRPEARYRAENITTRAPPLLPKFRLHWMRLCRMKMRYRWTHHPLKALQIRNPRPGLKAEGSRDPPPLPQEPLHLSFIHSLEGWFQSKASSSSPRV